jgi:hypothetical protein
MADILIEYFEMLISSGFKFVSYLLPLVLLYFIVKAIYTGWKDGTLFAMASYVVFMGGGLFLGGYHIYQGGGFWVSLLIMFAGLFIAAQVNERLLRKRKNDDLED